MIFIVENDGPGRTSIAQSGEHGGHHIDLQLSVLVAILGFFLQGDDAPLQRIQIGQHQFGFDGFRIANRVDGAFHMRDIAVFKATQHMDDGVGFTDVGQELVAQPLAP